MRIGTMAISAEIAMAGTRPSIIPRISLGRSASQCRKNTLLDRNWTLEMIPIRAAGIDQKMTIAATNP